jgi:hypothetical protein
MVYYVSNSVFLESLYSKVADKQMKLNVRVVEVCAGLKILECYLAWPELEVYFDVCFRYPTLARLALIPVRTKPHYFLSSPTVISLMQF